MGWTVYCHTHTETGRRYIGITKNSWLRRWKDHVRDALGRKFSRVHFHRAIRSYGPSAFAHEILEVCTTLDVASVAEASWVAFYATTNPEFGFNRMPGGYGARPHPIANAWDRPGHRERVVASLKKAFSNPELREASSSRMKALGESALAPMRAAHAAMIADPVYRAANAERLAHARAVMKAKGIRPRANQTHCKHGHEFTPENTGRQQTGRRCRTCHNAEGRSAKRPRVRVMTPEQKARKVHLQRIRRGRQ